jgi:hypothetical protein
MSKKFIDGMNKTFKIVDKFKDSPMKYKILDNMEKEIKNKKKVKLTWEAVSVEIDDEPDYKFQDHLDEIKTIEKVNK